MKLGATGKFPEGKLHEGDEGELALGVAHDSTGRVHVNFGKDVSWFALSPGDAIDFACLLLQHAGVAKTVRDLVKKT